MGACPRAWPPRLRWCILGDDRKMNPNVAASDNVLAPQAPGEELRRQVDSPAPVGFWRQCFLYNRAYLLMVHGFCRQCFRQSRAKFFIDSAASFSAKAVPSFAGNWTPRGSLFPCKFLEIFVAKSLTIWVASLSTKLPKPFIFKPFWRECQILGPQHPLPWGPTWPARTARFLSKHGTGIGPKLPRGFGETWHGNWTKS